MALFVLLCLLVAAVCFLLAALNVAVTRVGLVALGLFAWVLPDLVKAFQAVQ